MLIICLSSLLTGSPGKEHRITKPSPTKEFKQRPRGAPTSFHLPESSSLASILAEHCAQPRGGPWGRRAARRTGPRGPRRAVGLGSLSQRLSAWAPPPVKSPAFSARLSPQTTQVQASDKKPPWGHGWGRLPAAPALYFCEMTSTCAEGGRARGENLKLPPGYPALSRHSPGAEAAATHGKERSHRSSRAELEMEWAHLRWAKQRETRDDAAACGRAGWRRAVPLTTRGSLTRGRCNGAVSNSFPLAMLFDVPPGYTCRRALSKFTWPKKKGKCFYWSPGSKWDCAVRT